MNAPQPMNLPAGIRSRFMENVNGLRMHILEAGYDQNPRPLILLLHGFPELAYSWRNIITPLADLGYHVVAPDQRGFGRTTGWSNDYDQDLRPFNLVNLVRDAVALVNRLGYSKVNAVFGHDFGSSVAAYAGLIRPDLFQAVSMMSAPFAGAPSFADTNKEEGPDIFEELGRLPRPRKHYHKYYSTRGANGDMLNCPQGLHNFLRGYFHGKSADWSGNDPAPLKAWTAENIEPMPTYYIMDLNMNMAETVALHMPSDSEVSRNTWLPESALSVYTEEYGRTGFQGGLNGYRMGSSGIGRAEQQLYAGRTIDQPSMFISGASDWGTYQSPGNFERMQERACTDMREVHLVEGAGHWVQQEQAEETSRLLLGFLGNLS